MGQPHQLCLSPRPWSLTPTLPPSPHLLQCPLPRPSLCMPPPPRPLSTSPPPPRSQLTSLHPPPPSQLISLQPPRSPHMLRLSPPMPRPGLCTSPSPATSLHPSRLTMLLPPLRPQLPGHLTMSPSRPLTSSTLVTLQSTFTSSPRCWSNRMSLLCISLHHPPSLHISLQPPANQLQSTSPSPRCLSTSHHSLQSRLTSHSLQSKLTTHLPASLPTNQCQSLNTVHPSQPKVLFLGLMSPSLLRSIKKHTSLSPPRLLTSLLLQLSLLTSLLPQPSLPISLLPPVSLSISQLLLPGRLTSPALLLRGPSSSTLPPVSLTLSTSPPPGDTTNPQSSSTRESSPQSMSMRSLSSPATSLSTLRGVKMWPRLSSMITFLSSMRKAPNEQQTFRTLLRKAAPAAAATLISTRHIMDSTTAELLLEAEGRRCCLPTRPS